MASKPPNINSVLNRDIMQRMNYLWQASVYLQSLNISGGPQNLGVDTNQEGELKDNDVPGSTSSEGNPTTTRECKGATATTKEKKKKKAKRKTVDGRDLARIYVKTMKAVGQKTTTKMDPGVKRTLCKGCSIVLIPGVSVRIRVRPNWQYNNWMVYTCLECGTSRSIFSPKSGKPSEGDSSTETTMTTAPTSGVELSTTTTTIDVDPSASGGGSIDRRPREDNQTGDSGGGGGGGDEPALEDSTEDLQEDATGQKQKEGVPRKPGKRKNKVITRVPPLFARRDAGHVVYRGGEVVDMEGVYCV